MSLRRKLPLAVAGIAMLLGLAAAPATAQDPDAPSIAEIAVDDGRFSLLVTALTSAGLDATFADCDSDAQYTVLAPVDDAFTAALEENGLDGATLLGDTENLTKILQYHVLEGANDSAAVAGLDGTDVTTLSGEDIGIAVDGEAVTISSANPNPATVTEVDIQACNGIIHVIDNVLFPPTVAEALGITGAGGDDGDAAEGGDDAADEAEGGDDAADEAEGGDEALANTGAGSDALALAGLTVIAAGALVAGTARRRR
jgi:LPXTG-motif cell wall-anchored protein